jgi:gamma-glutamylaminecyclotransferase
MIRLFVLGTLKRGFPLHEHMEGATFLGRYRTVDRLPMLVAGPRFAPMLLDEPGLGYQVRGELYELDPERLAHIDALESVGRPGNFRKEIAVESVDGGRQDRAQVYIKSRDLAVPAHTGYLEDYQDRRFTGIRR